ncbi:hypothetical protein QBC44DRAFT_378619, partial [Cladorrhinum sp. PSN332]
MPHKGGLSILYPSIARGTGANILGLIVRAAQESENMKLPIYQELRFLTCFNCEWAYVVDLDKEVLEVYKGWGARVPKHDGHRFKDIGDAGATVPGLVRTFDFSG